MAPRESAALRAIPPRCRQLFAEVVENDLVEVAHRAEEAMAEVGPQMVPQRALAAQLLPDRAEQRAAGLLDLIHEEGQHQRERRKSKQKSRPPLFAEHTCYGNNPTSRSENDNEYRNDIHRKFT